ncbi:MAG: DUF2157 domain-containing protein [Gemmatimonadaceae bacterium]
MNSRALLDAGVEKGIISAGQRDALLGLAGREGKAAEAGRALNGVTIAYGVGALVVLFAFGWFLADRWKVLGPSGIFGVACAYAAVFLAVAYMTKREGFPVAHGVATLLTVAMVPLATWALLQWTGVWSAEYHRVCGLRLPPFGFCQGEPLAVELSAILAALVALRRVPFPPLTIPIAVVSVSMPERFIREWTAVGYSGVSMGWRWVIVASLVATAAYVIDRRMRDDDYGLWFWVASSFATLVGTIAVLGGDAYLRWYLGPVSLVVLVASVYLRRRILLALGIAGVFGYLAWLASDVFKLTLAFPLLLAVLGVAIIIVTVWLQRRFPEIVRRVGGDPSLAPSLPGGVFTLLAPALIGLLMMGDAARMDREHAANQRSRSRAGAARNRVQQDSVVAARRARVVR